VRRIYKKDEAREDLAGIVDYYAAIRLELALRFLDAVEATLAGLLEMPGKGSKCEYSHPRYVGMRLYTVNGFEKYVLYYRPISDGIELIRVLYGGRDRDAIFGRRIEPSAE